jgi:uncharacterized protein (DUF1499 family)
MWIAVYVVASGLAALVLAIAVVLLTHVEDWSRDLTTNVAATSDDADDQRLRTIRSRLSPGELAEQTVAAARTLPRWELAGQSRDNAAVELQLVRTTGLMGYKDDIRVRIEPAEGGSRLSAESRSRVGKGDLGQNPRNLRELLGKLREVLDMLREPAA